MKNKKKKKGFEIPYSENWPTDKQVIKLLRLHLDGHMVPHPFMKDVLNLFVEEARGHLSFAKDEFASAKKDGISNESYYLDNLSYYASTAKATLKALEIARDLI